MQAGVILLLQGKKENPAQKGGDMPIYKFQGKELEIDRHGHLINFYEWSEEIAKQFAHDNGHELTKDHWEILNLLREHYERYKISPINKIFYGIVKDKFGSEKGSSTYLLWLFPESPAVLACKYAGLPKPCG